MPDLASRNPNRLLVTCPHLKNKLFFPLFPNIKKKKEKKIQVHLMCMYTLPGPGINHFSKELWFLCVGNSIRVQDWGVRYVHCSMLLSVFVGQSY